MADPDAKLSGVDGQFHGSITMSGVGGGLTWWVMPANFYFSGTLGVGLLSVEPDVGSSASTDTGFAAQVSLGKEWWVGDSWGLGVAGGFTYHNVPDGDVEENWSGTSFSIRFSATYN